MIKKINFTIVIPVLAAALFAALNFAPFYQVADARVYDLLLRIRPAVEEDGSILLVDVDDLAIEKVGMWPWSRSIMAEGLIRMREFGARYAVFDIEYTEESPLGVDSRFLRTELPDYLSAEFDELNRYIEDLFGALEAGSIRMEDAADYVADLTAFTGSSREKLLAEVAGVARDNDLLLGQAARFFGNAYFTVTTYTEESDVIDPDYERWVLSERGMKNVERAGGYPIRALSIRPAIPQILEYAGGAGSPTVVVDGDGVRRRIELIHEYGDAFIPQLAFAPLLDRLGNPRVVVGGDRIVLEGADIPQGGTSDIVIPLAEDGTMLINWPKKTFAQSFTHMTYYYLILHDLQEDDLVRNLTAMKEANVYAYYSGGEDFFNAYGYARQLEEEVLSGGSLNKVEEYIQARAHFFAEVGRVLDGDTERLIMDDIEAILQSEDYGDEEKASIREIGAGIAEVFAATRGLYENLTRTRSILAQNLKDSFCIIGWTGTSTTDVGVNPFDRAYINVGTHAAVINTILQRAFLDEVPWWYSAVGGLVLSMALFFIIRKRDAVPSILIGFGVFAGVSAVGILVFRFFGLDLHILTPALTVLVTLVALTISKFIITTREKGQIRNAFGHYLSNDVINQVLSDPDKLELGGVEKQMTALFTDIKEFSSISEKLEDPNKLVYLLNHYLGAMSDIIWNLRGTVDKYEGDAIISFFGAPIDYDDHAYHACRAAILMKKTETEMNRLFMNENLSPAPLLTRIGINTGKMVVGNMGTEKKMDYTIMGSSVNLASRLEGVNKQYGTWILISGATYDAGGKEFTVRKLDRVRVVGIDTPVRLYELVDEKESTETKTLEALDRFHEGLDYFEAKEWERAAKTFEAVLGILPSDGPSDVYLKRSNEYLKKAPPASWDGVFNLSVK